MGVGSARFEGVAAVGWRGPSLTAALGARGVLGLPTFRDCLLTIDYPKREIEVAPGSLPEVDGQAVLALDTRLIAEVPVDVAGRAASAHLDIGNGSSLIVPGSWERDLKIKGEIRMGRGMRASGPVEFKIATLDGELKIGKFAIHDPEVRFDDKLNHVNIGYGVLRGFSLTLDQKHDRIRFVPGPPLDPGTAATGAQPAPVEGRRRLGAALGMGSNGVAEVQMVVPGSAAEAAGLEAGDVLLSVDGMPMTNEAIIAALMGTAPIKLAVRRGETDLEIVLFAR